jgi:hypothetical protein
VLDRATADLALVVDQEGRRHVLQVEVGNDPPCRRVRNILKRTYRIRSRPLWPDFKVVEKAVLRPE